ncbi:MAG: lysylphosphatidylglycerol synthase transmembrane domain-containing protein [Candidatus Omnitrophica bacterium]|nr:lysylphosphatidylglycerol synthase transmembrane domain-containing protein [Candidatus Omnitrophota bacterium]MDD5573803.1 lysylphosphatidylglycerol synthase transmembrane domain-containing protein [Candidatus Omnitrophota bacterium]
MKKISAFFLRISITFGLLVFLFIRSDVRRLWTVILEADASWLLGAFVLFFLLNVLVFVRWLILLRGRGIHVSPPRLFLSYLTGQFFNLIFPSTIGGDAVRTLDISRHTKKHSSDILASVILDRVSGFLGLVTVLIFSLLFGYNLFNDASIFLATGILLVLVVLFSAMMFSGRFFGLCVKCIPFAGVRGYFEKIHVQTKAYAGQRAVLWAAWMISCVAHAGLAFVYYLVARAFGLEYALIYFLIFVPMITAFSSIPVSVGGLGVRDTASVFVFAKIGIAKESAFAMSLVNFGFMLILGVLGGIGYVYLLYRRRL